MEKGLLEQKWNDCTQVIEKFKRRVKGHLHCKKHAKQNSFSSAVDLDWPIFLDHVFHSDWTDRAQWTISPDFDEYSFKSKKKSHWKKFLGDNWENSLIQLNGTVRRYRPNVDNTELVYSRSKALLILTMTVQEKVNDQAWHPPLSSVEEESEDED